MEAFSDGVIAIIITIMVLELRVPHGADLDSLGDAECVGAGQVVGDHHPDGRRRPENQHGEAELTQGGPLGSGRIA